MDDPLLQSLEQIGRRLASAEEANRRLSERNEELETQNRELQRRAAEADNARDRALLDCEYLKVSHKLAESPDTLADTRRHLSKLIRNIDKCLEMLRE
ncbi:MAG: hypothetical protein NC204_07325 [Candidatus Amulumruptor caecigallinarius]|nr:hypothetical protein [Candidatus Amulumruptor caecigallinarius]